MKRENLAKAVNNASRKITVRGSRTNVPLLYDENGDIPPVDKVKIKSLSRNDFRFLLKWQETNYSEDHNLLVEKTGLAPSRVAWFCKNLECFKKEKERSEALARIPDVNHIKSRLYVNTITDELSYGQRDSLKELSKMMEGTYKNTSSVNVNVTHSLQLPKLLPEQEAQLRQLGDSIATTIETEAA